MWTCPDASEAHPMLLRYEWRKEQEVDNIWRVNLWKVIGPLGMKVVGFGYESHWLWVWSLEMVQRRYRGVGDIHMNRGS
jgi:hypothetical protein